MHACTCVYACACPSMCECWPCRWRSRSRSPEEASAIPVLNTGDLAGVCVGPGPLAAAWVCLAAVRTDGPADPHRPLRALSPPTFCVMEQTPVSPTWQSCTWFHRISSNRSVSDMHHNPRQCGGVLSTRPQTHPCGGRGRDACGLASGRAGSEGALSSPPATERVPPVATGAWCTAPPVQQVLCVVWSDARPQLRGAAAPSLV